MSICTDMPMWQLAVRDTLANAKISDTESRMVILDLCGHTRHEIAHMLNITPDTVSKYKQRVIAKLKVDGWSTVRQKCFAVAIDNQVPTAYSVTRLHYSTN